MWTPETYQVYGRGLDRPRALALLGAIWNEALDLYEDIDTDDRAQSDRERYLTQNTG